MEEFKAGQVWTYNTRSSEPESRVIVCLVETHPKLGEIVHIQVNGLRFKNKHAASGYSDQINHMPYSSKALRSCVVALESRGGEVTEFEEGYREWKSAMDNGKAGVWTIPLSDAVTGMEAAVNQ